MSNDLRFWFGFLLGIAVAIIARHDASHTMQPDCRNVSSVDPAHEYRNNPEPPR